MDLNLKSLQDLKSPLSLSKSKNKKIKFTSLSQLCLKNVNKMLDSPISNSEFSESEDFSENIDDSDDEEIILSEGESNIDKSEGDNDLIEFDVSSSCFR